MPAPRILLVEDDPVLGPALLQRLKLEGFDAHLAPTGASAVAAARARAPDIVLSDIRLPDFDGEVLWRKLVDTIGPVPSWFMTAHGDIAQAVRLVKAGARDYLSKPVDVDALIAALGGAQVVSQSESLGTAPAIRALEAQLLKAARVDLPVLLNGETGSGKEVAARFLHAASPRADAPFIAINCGAIPRELAESMLFGHEKGAFTGATIRRQGVAEEAASGTLFLDEIAELPLDLQAKLLRLVEAREFRPLGAKADLPFRARIVAATHADLAERVRAGAFREDLFFRLNVVPLAMPPLRARTEDIAILAHRFLPAAHRKDFAPEALEALLAHDWPGNVRELRNRVERAVALGDSDTIGVDDLFPETTLDFPSARGSISASLDEAAKSAIKDRVRDALAKTGGNRSEAARLLGVSRTTIWKYMRP